MSSCQEEEEDVTYSKVIKVVGPVAQLLVGPTLHAEVGGDVLHGGVGEHTGTQTHTSSQDDTQLAAPE